jgi:predicted RNA-binding Zn-ribbon protein involved in translation (DUF1610 family)
VSAVHAVRLPHGVLAGTERRRHAALRPPRGEDEAFLLEDGAGLTRAEQVTALLARCVVEIGGEEPGPDGVRGLTAGDREALLLQLRAAALGDRIACVLDCPDCGERLDLDLEVGELLVDGYPEARPWHELRVGNGWKRLLRVRLPTGADLESAGHEPDDEAGARTLIARCVEGDLPEDGEGVVAARLAELDPQAETLVRTGCPECGAEIAALLDAATILLGELAGSPEALFREVHAIASHYHWSEPEILALDIRRRRRYLELIADGEGA